MQAAGPLIEVLYFAGCPNHEPTVDLAREVLGELGLEAEVREVAVETLEAAETQRFLGSPTVRVDGKDIEPDAEDETQFALGCRMYGKGGVPPKELIMRALRAASSR